MKILQLGKFYPVRGGVEKVMWDLTRGLAERGIPCDMLCAMLRSDTVDPAHRAMAAEHDGVRVLSFSPVNRVFCVPARMKKAGTMLSPAMIRWLRRHAAEYDLIHIHHPDPMAALALRLSGFRGKVILHWHSDIVSQKFFLFFYRPLQSWLIRRADRIVGTSPVYLEDSDYLRKYQDKTCCIPIGVDPVLCDSQKISAFRADYSDKMIIFALGRLVPYKGFDCLIRAAARLGDEYRVLIGGSGPLREELDRQIRLSGQEQKVKLLGYVRDEDLPVLFGACDVFVMSSQWKTEAFGIVQIEAMSCGKPVVATEIPGSGVSWVNAHGVSGLNVPPQDDRAMAGAIEEICADPDTYRRYAAGAAARYEACFAFRTMIDRTERLYEEYDETKKI